MFPTNSSLPAKTSADKPSETVETRGLIPVIILFKGSAIKITDATSISAIKESMVLSIPSNAPKKAEDNRKAAAMGILPFEAVRDAVRAPAEKARAAYAKVPLPIAIPNAQRTPTETPPLKRKR